MPICLLHRKLLIAVLIVAVILPLFTTAQMGSYPASAASGITVLDHGWRLKKATELKSGKQIGPWATAHQPLQGWAKATVPGTVLTSLLNNGRVPDPFYGMNNQLIADIHDVGKDYYTYWFVKDFKTAELQGEGKEYFLHLRGVNYGFDAYLNGHRLNKTTLKGMFMRRSFNITQFLAKDGNNRLAIIVYPPDVVGNPNGGQGGDGTIARNVAHQYVAGWDWIQPIRDRNTGIWDKIWIAKKGPVQLLDPHVITLVPGKRDPDLDYRFQAPAYIHSELTVKNSSDRPVNGRVLFLMAGDTISQAVSLEANELKHIALEPDTLYEPMLWWASGMEKKSNQLPKSGSYGVNFRFQLEDGALSDSLGFRVGVRQIDHQWNTHTRSMEVLVNGQPLFIRGGNWIVSDAMLRLSPVRYDAEVRMHRDMGLNLIRVWGGALTERPEFYEACDKYGILVMQDFWGSGDCNGRWMDPMKKDDIWARRAYPDDHALFVSSAADQIKMLRNHASLAIWCGGNEITLPSDLQDQLQQQLLPSLDSTRWYIDFSNSDSMSFNSLGGNGDGPYGIQPVGSFWKERTYPFNSEVGSVGIGDLASLERFLPKKSLPALLPTPDAVTGYDKTSLIDSFWQYHKYIGYGNHLAPYGLIKSTKEFAKISQLVNYNQYRSMMEGFSSHQWDWYTGFIIWKTQNPWTAMRGQMYDYYLDPNACLYGLKAGAEQTHLMFNPVDSGVYIINSSYQTMRNMVMEIELCSFDGTFRHSSRTVTQAIPQHPKLLLSIKGMLERPEASEGLLLNLRLLDLDKNVISEQTYWTSNRQGAYTGLQKMPQTTLQAKAHWTIDHNDRRHISLKLSLLGQAPPAFFNRISILNKYTGERILPSFYEHNYVTILPGETKWISLTPATESEQMSIVHPVAGAKAFVATSLQDMVVEIEGWNSAPIRLGIEGF